MMQANASTGSWGARPLANAVWLVSCTGESSQEAGEVMSREGVEVAAAVAAAAGEVAAAAVSTGADTHPAVL